MTHIHTKLFMRRLAYVPWLLTVGLVLGWNGEAGLIMLEPMRLITIK